MNEESDGSEKGRKVAASKQTSKEKRGKMRRTRICKPVCVDRGRVTKISKGKREKTLTRQSLKYFQSI